MINAITRSQLAMLLDDESYSVIAEHIRAGSDPQSELGDGSGGLRKALSRSRYDDGISRRAQAIFAGIVAGTMRERKTDDERHVTINPALLPSPALFDVTSVAKKSVEGQHRARVAREIELAPNARREISPEGIDRLAAMLARTGQLVPCIGHRSGEHEPVVLYDGQRRYLAATQEPRAVRHRGLREPRAGQKPDRAAARPRARARGDPPHPVAGQQRARGPHARRPARTIPRLLAGPRRPGRRGPSRRRLRRPRDQRPQGAEPAPTADPARGDPHPSRRAPSRRAAVGHDRQPARGHERDRAGADQGGGVSGSPPQSCTTRRSRTSARSCTAPWSRTSTPTRCGSTTARCSTRRSRSSTPARTSTRKRKRSWPACSAASPTSCRASSTRSAARAKAKALKIKITGRLRDRARTGRYAFVHERGQDFADSIWVIDPVFMLDLVREQLAGRQRPDAGARGGVLRRRQAPG